MRVLFLYTAVFYFLLNASPVPAFAAPTMNIVSSHTTGSEPFDADDSPGNDSSATNSIVRTNDVISYRMELSVVGEDADNTTVTLRFDDEFTVELPSFCRTSGVTPSSSITSGGGATILTCNVGNRSAGSSATLNFPMTVNPDLPNGDTITLHDITLQADGTALQTYAGFTDTVSAAPKLDLVAQSPNVRSLGTPTGPNGEAGRAYTYTMLVRATDFGKGNELITGPLSFSYDLSDVSPNARLYTGWVGAPSSGCLPNFADSTSKDHYQLALPHGVLQTSDGGPGGSGEGPLDASVWDSGTISCPAPTPGNTGTVTISGADFSQIHNPTLGVNNTTLDPSIRYYVSAVLYVWVPDQDLIDAGGSLRGTLTYGPLMGQSIGNQSNTEPDTSNNARRVDMSLVQPDGNSEHDLFYARDFNNASTYIEDQTSRRTGDGILQPGVIFSARQRQTNANTGSQTAFENYSFCMSFDNAKQQVYDISGAAGPARMKFNRFPSGLTPNFTIEYGAGAHGADAECDDADSPIGWQVDPDDLPGGRAAATKIRARTSDPFLPPDPSSSESNTLVQLIARFISLPTTGGELIVTYGTHKADNKNGGEWSVANYDPLLVIGDEGDRATATDILARVNKDTTPSNEMDASAGDGITFVLQPALSSSVSPPPVLISDLTIIDTLHASYSYISGSASIAPDSVTLNDDNTTTLVWTYTNQSVGNVIPQITYDVLVKPIVIDGTNAINTAVASSPDDYSPEENRTDSHTILIQNIEEFAIFKEVSEPFITTNNLFGYKLFYANSGKNPIATVQMIDVFPNTALQATPSTIYSGDLEFLSVTVGNNETIEYTSRTPPLINPDPNDASNQPGGATDWCLALSGGICPASNADVTAVRITSGNYASGTPVREIELQFTATGYSASNRYTNTFSARAAGFSLPLTSNSATVEVRTSDLSVTKIINNETPVPGDPVVFTVTVANAGPHNSSNVTITDKLPSGYSYTGHSGDGTYDPVFGGWDLDNIAVGASASIQISAIVNATGDYENIAEVTSTVHADPDSTASNHATSPDEDDSAIAGPIASLDHDDAPASYGAAEHNRVVGIRLGPTITVEAAGYDDPAAAEDAGDDGVTFGVLNIAESGIITVAVVGDGFLNAWIDFDGSQIFDDPAERVAYDVIDTDGDGTISLNVSVPAWATSSQTIARFRWSSEHGLSATGTAADGEVEDYAYKFGALGSGGTRLSGAIILDNGIDLSNRGTPHDGLVNGAEFTGRYATVSIIQTSDDAVIATATVNPDGSWEAILPLDYNDEIHVIAEPAAEYLSISEATGNAPSPVNISSTDGLITFTPTANATYTGIDFGVIEKPTLTQNQSTSVAAGQIVELAHVYTATSEGAVSFALVDQFSTPVDTFSSVIMEDNDCDGSGEVVLNTSLSFVKGQQICITVRTQVSSGVGNNASHTYGLTAHTTFSGIALMHELRNDDRLGAYSTNILVLEKLVRNVTSGTPEGRSNTGAPNDVLEYRLILKNPTDKPVSNVIVNDATPAFTALADSVMSPVTGTNITCDITAPSGGANASGYVGALRWDCAGIFSAGQVVDLTFQVRILP